MGIHAIKSQFQKFLSPIANLCIKQNVHPTTINILGVLIALITAGSLFAIKENTLFYLALPIGAFLRTACNAIDGMVARGLHLSSQMGEVINELLDRISDASVFVALAISNHGNSNLALISTVLLLLNSYVGILGKSAGGSRIYAGVLGKADRMLLLGVAGIFSLYELDVWNIFYMIVSVGSFVSILQRLHIINKELTHGSSK